MNLLKDKNANPKKSHIIKKDGVKSNEDKSNSLLVVFLITALVIIILGVLFLFNKPDVKKQLPPFDPVYNGYIFNETSNLGLWRTVVKTPKGDVPIDFYYHPREVENYSYNNNITRDVANIILRKGNFLIGYDVGYSDNGIAALAGSEISRITGKVFDISTKSGFVDSVGDSAIPIINCSLANYKNLVLEFRPGSESKIVYDNNYCITIYSEVPEDMLKLADFLDYKLLGVIPGRATSMNSSLQDNMSRNDSSIKSNISYLVNGSI